MDAAQIKALLQKQQAGQLTDEEKAILDTWYLKLAQTETAEVDETDMTNRLDAVLAGLGTNQRRPEIKTRRLWPRIAAAASILLCLSIGLYFYQHKTQKQGTNTQIAKNDIAPGTNGAILTLANGQKIILEHMKVGKITKQNGADLSKAGDSLLVYQKGAALTPMISYNTLETPMGKQYAVVLPDGTKVWLNASSSLKYPTSFSGGQRLVELIGEAYFEVIHNSRMPFRVSTGNQVVEDIGTEFNINAYADEQVVKTTLIAGRIKINRGHQEKLLKPDEQAVAADNEEIKITTVDTEPVLAWKNGDFIFKDEDFKAAMRQVARWYNVEVVYDPSAPDNFIPGGWISRSKNISAILNIMESTGKVHFKIEGRRITVTK